MGELEVIKDSWTGGPLLNGERILLLVPSSNVKDSVLPSMQFKIVSGLPGPEVQCLSAPNLSEDPKGLTLRKSSKIIFLLLLLGKCLLLWSAVPGLNVPISKLPGSIMQLTIISCLKMENLRVTCSDLKISRNPCSLLQGPSMNKTLEVLSCSPRKFIMDGDSFVM